MRTAPRSRESYLAEASRLCRKHGAVFYTAKRDEFCVYRRYPTTNHAPVFVGKRTSPAKLVELIRNATQAA
jgi:hypothetical protein